MAGCIFCNIAGGKIPAEIVAETEDAVAFRDVDPQAPTHVLIVPRKHIPTLNDLAEEDAPLLGKMALMAKEIAKKDGIAESGWRAVLNTNEGAGQSVFHVHLHVLGGRPMTWPPG